MSMSHHSSPEESEASKRLLDQFLERAQEHFNEGRLNKQDQGDLSFAIAADPRNGVIQIHFGKPVKWVGLNRKNTEQLIGLLTEKLKELP